MLPLEHYKGHTRKQHNNPEIEAILSDIEDILNSRWQDKSWTAGDILQMQNGLEVLTMDALEVAEANENEEDNDTDDNEEWT